MVGTGDGEVRQIAMCCNPGAGSTAGRTQAAAEKSVGITADFSELVKDVPSVVVSRSRASALTRRV